MRFILFFIFHIARKAAYQTLEGRLFERGCPERGRLLRQDVNQILYRARKELDQLLLEAKLECLPTIGSRHNTILALFTITAYHAVVKQGIEPAYAIELVADVGWKLYVKMVAIPKFVARLLHRDPQKQMKSILRLLMIYPFSAPGRPGYELKAWDEDNRYCTFWTHCPPYQAVRDYIERHGDLGEIDAFKASWCSYDWSLTYAMIDGSYRQHGYYKRPHTISDGDEVCDMYWYSHPPASEPFLDDQRKKLPAEVSRHLHFFESKSRGQL